MCGIAGSIGGNNVVDEGVLKSLAHRGPDDQSFVQLGEVILYHARLAIQDVQSGMQPMYLDEELAIVFNGEIYNHLSLREKHKLHCTTRSDTETVLLLYKKLGIEFLHELDGMFAFALLDRANNQLWLARDRAGKKPVYYYQDERTIFFASELNTIKAAVSPQINHEYFYEYLRLGSFFNEHTPYKNVRELPAGTYLTIDIQSRQCQQTKWWSIKPFYLKKSIITEAEAISQADQMLHEAVKRRLESSDLEVGCFLSGGIDSGLIASIAAQYNSRLKTFTVAFDGRYNEAPLAKMVADKIQSAHHEINIDFSDLQANIETILNNYGEPFTDSSAIPTWYVSREAKKHVTVILNGDGADELFGGYRRYVPFAKYDFFTATPLVRKIATSLNKMMLVSHDKLSLYNYFYRLTGLVQKNNLDVYLSAGTDIFEGLPKSIFRDYSSEKLLSLNNAVDEMIEGIDGGLRKLMLLDFNISLFSALLVKMDIGSMAHALEGRSPFLCKELLEWAPTLPGELKIKGRNTKYLLRQLAKNYLPSQLIHQPKRGFEIPLKDWVDTSLKEIIHAYLYSANSFNQLFITKDFLDKIWEGRIKIGKEKRAKILWTLFSMEIWYKNTRSSA